MALPELLMLFALGFVVGAYGTMVGIGGGFILVPIFLFLGEPAKVAAGTSLAVVLANAVSGTASYLRQRRIDVAAGTVLGVAGIPGAILGAYVDQHIPHRIFVLLFGLLLAAVAIRLFITPDSQSGPSDEREMRGTPRDFVDVHGVRHRYAFKMWEGAAIGVGVGFLASAFGIGGGVIQVPAMVYLFGFPAHVAVATSTLIIAITSLAGTASHVYFNDVAPALAIAVAAGAVLGAPLGARLASRLKTAPLLRWLSLALIAAAIWLLFGKR